MRKQFCFLGNEVNMDNDENKSIAEIMNETPIRHYAGLYYSHLSVIEEVRTAAARLAWYDALTLYLFYGIEPNFECPTDIDDHGTGTIDADYRILRAMWKGIKPVIDKKLSKIDNGSKGGRPKKDKRPMREDDTTD